MPKGNFFQVGLPGSEGARPGSLSAKMKCNKRGGSQKVQNTAKRKNGETSSINELSELKRMRGPGKRRI